MVQVKLFTERSNGGSAPIEKKINDFLQQNEKKIVVKDIKYTAVSISDSLTWQTWAVMVIYEVK